MDGEEAAWKIVRRVRDRFLGLKREPTDDDWVEEITAVLSRYDVDGVDDDYETGFDDALAEIEDAARSAIYARERKKRAAKISGNAATVQPVMGKLGGQP